MYMKIGPVQYPLSLTVLAGKDGKLHIKGPWKVVKNHAHCPMCTLYYTVDVGS